MPLKMHLLARPLSFLCLLFVLVSPLARAELSIEITGAGAERIPIAIVPFVGEEAFDQPITAIVRADLERSGPTGASRCASGCSTW